MQTCEQIDDSLARLEIRIPHLSNKQLIERAKDTYYILSGRYFMSNSPIVLQRICVNYLRHNCTPYDKIVKSKMVISEENKINFTIRVFSEIALAYPHLKEECIRQLQNKI